LIFIYSYHSLPLSNWIKDQVLVKTQSVDSFICSAIGLSLVFVSPMYIASGFRLNLYVLPEPSSNLQRLVSKVYDQAQAPKAYLNSSSALFVFGLTVKSFLIKIVSPNSNSVTSISHVVVFINSVMPSGLCVLFVNDQRPSLGIVVHVSATIFIGHVESL